MVEKITESNKNTTSTLIQTFRDQQQKGFAEVALDIASTKQKLGHTYKELSERKQKDTEKMREIKRLVEETTANHAKDSKVLTGSMELVRKRLETLTAKPKKRTPALACGKPKKVLK
jgi:small-conductance mechanosensitive channel